MQPDYTAFIKIFELNIKQFLLELKHTFLTKIQSILCCYFKNSKPKVTNIFWN